MSTRASVTRASTAASAPSRAADDPLRDAFVVAPNVADVGSEREE